MSLVPAGLSLAEAGALVALSFFTSGMTASLSLGGGVVFLAVLATLAPAGAVVPVHGVVQFGSNLGRVLVNRRTIVWPMAAAVAGGSLAGAAVGGSVVVELPERALKLVLGVFILYATWGRLALPVLAPRRGVLVAAGAASSFLTMFVGATGPFVSAFLAPRLGDRRFLVGTHAACMLAQHGIKAVAFGLLGFAFGPWLPLLAAIIAAGFLGTLAGTRLLRRLPERRFRQALRIALTLVAAYLLWAAAGLASGS